MVASVGGPPAAWGPGQVARG